MAASLNTRQDDTIAPEEASREGKVDLRDFLAILRGRVVYIAIPTAVALLLAVIYLTLATRLYTGVTSILIDARIRPAVGDTANVNNYSPDAILVESQVRLISSDTVLRRVVEAQHLADDPEFAPTRPGLRTRLMTMIGLAPATRPDAADNVTRAMVSFAGHVVVKRSERTYIADIEVTSADPAKAARLADAVAQAYLDDQQAARNDAADRDSEWVHGQIGAMQAGLREAELKADAYKREHGIIDTNGKLLSEQELADASAGLTLARTRATETKARLDQIQRITSAGRNLDTLPDALKSPLIDKLRGQYADISRQQATLRQTLGARHPALLESDQQLRDIRRLIIEELGRVQAGMANEYQADQDNVAALDKHVQTLKQATSASNENRVRLDELQRDIDARRAVYDRFLRARDTVREQTVDAPIGRVIAPALIPSAASSPKTFAVLMLALAAGLGLGVGCALVADLLGWHLRVPRWNLRLPRWTRSAPSRAPAPARAPAQADPAAPAVAAAQAEPGFVVPILGAVPSPFRIGANLTSRGWLFDRLRTAWPTTIDAEHVPSLPTFRTAVQALGLFDGDPGSGSLASPRTLLITSLGEIESRTTLSLGLAEAAAAQGRRAIVIDADDRGEFMRELVAPGARPALMDLMGTTRLCYRVVAPYRGSLSIVPLVPGEAQIARRLEHQSTTLRIDGIAENFEFVVFDGPSIAHAARIEAMAGSVDVVIVAAPRDVTRAEIDRAVATLDLPVSCKVAAVLLAGLAGGDRASEAA